MPSEIGSSPVAGWAYRAEPVPREPVVDLASTVVVSPAPVKEAPAFGGLLTAGAEAVALGLAAVSRVFFAAASLFGAPVGITRRWLRF